MSEAVEAFESAKSRARDMGTWRLKLWIRSLRRRIRRTDDELDKARLIAAQSVLHARLGATPLGQSRVV